MNKDQVLDEFRDAGALLEGHFKLSSGLHSPVYMQCARVLMDPKRATKLCSALANNVRDALGDTIDMVVSPAMGGVVVGYEMARQLGVNGVFTERVNGQLELRRGFEIPKGARVLMVEDIVTTGLSSRECIKCIEDLGGIVVGATCLVDRSNGTAELGVQLFSLAAIDAPIFKPEDVPEALKDIPAIKPGSRDLKA